MGKKIGFVMVLLGFTVNAQKDIYVRPGLISASATISPTMMLNRAESNYYVSGFLEGRLDDHLSFRGESHYFVDGNNDFNYFKSNFRTHFGIQYHLSKNNFDAHLGFLPGVALMEVNNDRDMFGNRTLRVVPSFGINLGVSYYVWKFFHFFGNVSYFNSSVRGLASPDAKSDEIMISAGLGYNVNLIRKK